MPRWTSVGPGDTFPEPPRHGLLRRYGGSVGSFAIFADLSQIKAAITNDCRSDYLARGHYEIYEWDGSHWQLIYDIPKDTNRLAHELWAKGPAPKHRQVIAQDDVDAAIASIASSLNQG